MGRRDWTLLLILGAVWGSSYLLIKIGLRDFSPAMVVFGRVTLGAAVLLPIAARRGALAGMRPLWPVLLVVALVQIAGPFALISAGEQHLSSALAGVLIASAPIFTAILAIAFDPEDRSQGMRGAGVIVGIVGVGVLLGFDLGTGENELIGAIMVVLASLGYAIGGLLLKKRLGGLEPIGIAAVVLSISAAATLPFALAGLPDQAPAAGPVAAIATLGVVGTGLAFAIFYTLIARVGPSRAFVVSYVAPAWAVVYGAVLLDESITVATIAGLALIVGGSYLAAEGRLPRRRRADDPGELPDPDPGAGGLDPGA